MQMNSKVFNASLKIESHPQTNRFVACLCAAAGDNGLPMLMLTSPTSGREPVIPTLK